jgi:hypothetical protein
MRHRWLVAVPFGLFLAGTTVGLGPADGVSAAPPAQAVRAGRWIEVLPEAAEPGTVVTVRADCGGDNTAAVSGASTAFGTITLRPAASLLYARVQVSSQAWPGAHDVTLTCGPGRTAASTIWVLGDGTVRAESTVGPATGGGALAGRPRTGLWGTLAATAALSAAALALALPALVPALRRRVR